MIRDFILRSTIDAAVKEGITDHDAVKTAAWAIADYMKTNRSKYGLVMTVAPDTYIRRQFRKYKRQLERDLKVTVYTALSLPSAIIRLAAIILPIVFP